MLKHFEPYLAQFFAFLDRNPSLYGFAQPTVFLTAMYLIGRLQLGYWFLIPVLGASIFAEARRQERNRNRQEIYRMLAFEKLSSTDPAVSALLNVGNPQDRSLPSWVVFPKQHRLEWINEILRKMWPHLDKAISDTIVQSLNPIFAQVKPAFITEMKFREFKFGEIPPSFQGVEVVATDDDEIMLDIPMRWAGDPTIVFATTVVSVGSLPLDLPISVTELELNAVLRIQLKPLVDVIPCIGILGISFATKPSINFNVKTMHMVDLMSVPGLGQFIDSLLKSNLASFIVYPKKIAIPMLPPELLSKFNAAVSGENEVKNVLIVRMINCVRVPKTNLLGSIGAITKTNLYAEISLVGGGSKKTSVKNGTSRPEFNETFNFFVPGSLGASSLLVRIRDKNDVLADETMCTLKLSLADLAGMKAGEEFVDEYKVPNTKDTVMKIGLTWKPLASASTVASDQPAAADSTTAASGSTASTAAVATDSINTGAGSAVSSTASLPTTTEPGSREISLSGTPSASSQAMPPVSSLGSSFSGSKMELHKKGLLTVTIVSASNLKDSAIGSCDPFVDVKLGHASETRKNTKCISKTTNPVWNETFTFEIHNIATDFMRFDVYDKNALKNTHLGDLKVDVRDVAMNNYHLRKSYDLMNVTRGSLLLDFDLKSF